MTREIVQVAMFARCPSSAISIEIGVRGFDGLAVLKCKVVVKGAFVSRVQPAKGPAVFSVFSIFFMQTSHPCSQRVLHARKNARPPMNLPGGSVDKIMVRS